MEKRIIWIDILRFLGIWAIYIGHFGKGIGNLYDFVWIYHVPLFFFVSGVLSFPKDQKLNVFVKNKFFHLMLPYFFFSILSIMINVLLYGTSPTNVLLMFKQCILGLKDNTYAGQLWFFPAMFVMIVIYELLRRIIKNKYVSCLICLLVSLGLQYLQIPWGSWYYCIGYALIFIVYYAIGALCSSILMNFSFQKLTIVKKVFICLISAVFIVYTVGIFYGKDYIAPLINQLAILNSVYSLIKILVIIGMNIVIALVLSNIKHLQNIGRETLYMCGNEFIVKVAIIQLITLFGLQIQITNGLAASIYAFILLSIVLYVIVPIEKKMLRLNS